MSLSSRLHKLPAEKQAVVLKSKREEVFAALNKLHEQSQKLTDGGQKTFKSQLERLNSLETKFEEIQDLIIFFNAEVEDTSLTLETSQTYSRFMELIDTAKSNFLQATSMHSIQLPQLVTQVSHCQLPKIVLPTFSGNIGKWQEFYTLFSSLVDSDRTLTDANKFQYLRTTLQGDALSVISEFDFIPENYSLALEALKLRYENKRKLASLCLDRIYEFDVSRNPESSRTQLLNVLETNWNSLEKLGVPDLKDFVKLHISLRKLDLPSRRDFERRNASKKFPTYDDLRQYLIE